MTKQLSEYEAGDLAICTKNNGCDFAEGEVVERVSHRWDDKNSVSFKSTVSGIVNFCDNRDIEEYTESNSEPEQTTETITQEKQVKQLNDYKVGDKVILAHDRGDTKAGLVLTRQEQYGDDESSVAFSYTNEDGDTDYLYCDLEDIEEYVEPKNTQPELEHSVPVVTEQIQVRLPESDLPKSSLRAILQAHIDNKETYMKSELVQDKIFVTSDLVLVRIKEFCAKYEFSAILWCSEGWSISTNAYTKRNLTDLQLIEHLDAYNILFGE